MRFFALCFCALLGFSAPLAANPAVWTVDVVRSSVSFEYVESGKTKTGAFKAFSASINFDQDMPQNASASFSVETASIDLNDAMREGVLATVPWFDSERFPRADFSLTRLRPSSSGKYIAEGVLKIKKVELPVQLTINLSMSGRNARAKGVLEIDRNDFRLRDAVLESIVGIGQKVTIRFDLVATLDRE